MLGQELKGRYKIIQALRAGGFGQTYIAEDTQRPGTPKCVVKHLMPATNDTKFLEIARRLFKTEAQILEKVGRHDQIPQLLAYFEDNKEFYLVQEFIEGYPLNEELLPGKKLPEAQVLAILQDVLRILEFVHGHGAIHRDIKPNNIMRRKQDGKLVLIDFGAVKEIRTQLANSGEQSMLSTITVGIGTGGYIAPEQALGYPRFSSDIYALGMTAIQALTGLSPMKLPEDVDTGNIIWQNRVQISGELAAVLDKMICRNFSQRYHSAAEVLEALNNIVSFGVPNVVSPSRPLSTPSGQVPNSKFSISTELQAKLEEILGEAIGPIAKVILKQALNQAITPEDLVERLITNIPVNRQAEFRTSAQAIIAIALKAHYANTAFNTQVNFSTSAVPPPTKTTSSTVPLSQLDPAFIRRCEQELSNLIGPMAAFICKRTITQNPGLSPTQLVEALATQIPSQQQALEFRRILFS